MMLGSSGNPNCLRETLTLILAGVAINSLTAALTSLALNFAPSPYAALEIVFWILGSFADRTLDHVAMAAPAMVIGWAMLLTTGRALEAMTLGEETATTLGFDMRLLRTKAVIGTAFCVGAAVAGAVEWPAGEPRAEQILFSGVNREVKA